MSKTRKETRPGRTKHYAVSEELHRPLKLFGWALIVTGIFLHTLNLALYWTDFAFAGGILLLWIDVQKRRELPASVVDENEIIRQKLWAQEEPLLGVCWGCLNALAVTQFPVFLNYYKARNVIRNLLFLALFVCLVWLMVIQIRRDFGRSSKQTQEEVESVRIIRDSARRKREHRKARRNAKKPS